MKQIKGNPATRRVSAGAVAAMLAADEWVPALKRSRIEARIAVFESREKKVRMSRERERDRVDALPAGHPVSWKALWGGGTVPPFPGLKPICAYESEWGVN